MIRYSRDNKKYLLKKSRDWITIISTEQISVKSNSSTIINTGLTFWMDGGTIALLIEANMPPYIRIANKSLKGRTRLEIELYNASNQDVVLPIPVEMCYLIPITSAYYGNIELEEISNAWSSFGYGDNIAENS